MKTELKPYGTQELTKRVIVDGHAIGFISGDSEYGYQAIISSGMGKLPRSAPAFSCKTESEAVAILEKAELQSRKMLAGI